MQHWSPRLLAPVEGALLRLIGGLGGIGFAAGISGALVRHETHEAWPAVLGVALLTAPDLGEAEVVVKGPYDGNPTGM